MKIFRTALLFFFAAAFSSAAFGQIAADLRGRVLDSSGAGIANAAITLTDSSFCRLRRLLLYDIRKLLS